MQRVAIFTFGLTFIFILLQIGDIYTTLRAFEVGCTEGNPIMEWVMRKIGVVPALLFTKGIACLLAVFITMSFTNNVYWILALLAIDLRYIKVVKNNHDFYGD